MKAKRRVIEKRVTLGRNRALRNAREEPGPPKISVCGFFEGINFKQHLKDSISPVAGVNSAASMCCANIFI